MGNAPSQQPQLSDAVASTLSPRAQQRLSHQVPYMNFFEVAAVAPSAPPPRPKKKPSTTGSGSITSSTAGRSSRQNSKSSQGSSTNGSLSPRSGSNNSGSEKQQRSSSRTVAARMNSVTSESSTLVPLITDPPPKLEFTMLDGRRYLNHPDARFMLPIDDDESDRIVIMHFMLKYAFNSSFKAPVTELLNCTTSRSQVLDIGCGPGTWVLEMASDFPNADFHGIDLCPMFPNSIKPSNARFIQHNMLDTLPFADNSLDYIHMRVMLCNLTQSQLTRLLAEINRVLKPLGYIEIVDIEYRVQRPGPIAEQLLNHRLSETMLHYNIDFQLCYHLSTLLMTQQPGFVDVHQDRVTIPLGWGGQLGQIHGQTMEGFYQSLHRSVRQATTTDEYPEGLTEATIQEAMMECQKYQSHCTWYACYGQKPVNTSATNLVAGAMPQPDATSGIRRFSTANNNSNYNSTTSNPNNNKGAALATPAGSGVPAPIVEETAWESINDFVDGYVD